MPFHLGFLGLLFPLGGLALVAIVGEFTVAWYEGA